MKKNLRQLENLHDKFLTIPIEEWDAAADIVIAQKREETGNPKWLPRPLNGRLEFVERTIALVEKQRIERQNASSSVKRNNPSAF